jgi:hypothetical protein
MERDDVRLFNNKRMFTFSREHGFRYHAFDGGIHLSHMPPWVQRICMRVGGRESTSSTQHRSCYFMPAFRIPFFMEVVTMRAELEQQWRKVDKAKAELTARQRPANERAYEVPRPSADLREFWTARAADFNVQVFQYLRAYPSSQFEDGEIVFDQHIIGVEMDVYPRDDRLYGLTCHSRFAGLLVNYTLQHLYQYELFFVPDEPQCWWCRLNEPEPEGVAKARAKKLDVRSIRLSKVLRLIPFPNRVAPPPPRARSRSRSRAPSRSRSRSHSRSSASRSPSPSPTRERRTPVVINLTSCPSSPSTPTSPASPPQKKQ